MIAPSTSHQSCGVVVGCPGGRQAISAEGDPQHPWVAHLGQQAASEQLPPRLPCVGQRRLASPPHLPSACCQRRQVVPPHHALAHICWVPVHLQNKSLGLHRRRLSRDQTRHETRHCSTKRPTCCPRHHKFPRLFAFIKSAKQQRLPDRYWPKIEGN